MLTAAGGGSSYELALQVLARLPTNAMIQAALCSKSLRNSDSLPEMRSLLRKYSSTGGNLDFLKAVHVAGSKGKGSVCAFVESLLRRGGRLRTGMFTSPHLVHPRERIRLDGVPVSRDVFAKHVLALDEKLKRSGEHQSVSFFRFIWLVALEVFWEAGVDVGIIEVGIGGRFDATNVIDAPRVCGITSLAMEHVALLGPGIREIAWNKAGIMKRGVSCFTVPQSDPEAMAVLEAEAAKVECELQVSESFPFAGAVKLGIDGSHQYMNARLACSLATEWFKRSGIVEGVLSEDSMKSALQQVHWPGRQQIHTLSDERNLFLDGSHTRESVAYSAEWFASASTAGKKLLFYCSPDRDYRAMLKPLTDIPFAEVSFVMPSTTISGDNNLQEMADYWKSCTGQKSLVQMRLQSEMFDASGDYLICGSLYLVGEVMGMFDIET